jgi:hypothetical protein
VFVMFLCNSFFCVCLCCMFQLCYELSFPRGALKFLPSLNSETAKYIMEGNFRERKEAGLYIVYLMNFSVIIMVFYMFK